MTVSYNYGLSDRLTEWIWYAQYIALQSKDDCMALRSWQEVHGLQVELESCKVNGQRPEEIAERPLKAQNILWIWHPREDLDDWNPAATHTRRIQDRHHLSAMMYSMKSDGM
mmetsp:Transcript_52535/g.85129  ORF Transcript_52535/g.85129 Transcript_52535/m.85129 type:complete len:112 (+) Transcript_52535:317-652(+)